MFDKTLLYDGEKDQIYEDLQLAYRYVKNRDNLRVRHAENLSFALLLIIFLHIHVLLCLWFIQYNTSLIQPP